MSHPQSIISDQSLQAVRTHLERVGNVAVLHWHLFGARCPTALAFDDFETFQEYLQTSAKPGDAFDVWPFPTDSDLRIAQGKIPEPDGSIRTGGAY